MVVTRFKRFSGALPAVACLVSYGVYHAWATSRIPVPIWDGAVYIILARNLLNAQPLYEFFRPLVLPILIALTWSLIGVNYEAPNLLPLLFTVGAAWILYSLIKATKGRNLALLTMLVFLLAAPIMLWTDFLLPHSLSVFFVLLAVWLLNKGTLRSWLFAGLSSSVAILARYPTAVIVFAVFLVYLLEYRKLLLANVLALGAVIPIAPLYFYSPPLLLDVFERNFLTWSQISSGELAFASPSPVEPVQFYISAILQIFTTLVPFLILGLISRSTYRDPLTKVFAAWFIVAFIFFSLVPNKQMRFIFEWVPAIAVLSVSGIQTAWKRIGNLIDSGPNWKVPRISRRFLLGCSLLLLIGGSVLYAIGNQASIYSRDFARYENVQRAAAESVEVAIYVKNMTVPGDVVITDTQAPIMTLYSERSVYSIQVLPMDRLHLFLEIGYGFEWKRPVAVIFFPHVSGYDPNLLLQQDFLQLKTSFLVSKSLGTVYIFTFTG
jgi:hypothetical protein